MSAVALVADPESAPAGADIRVPFDAVLALARDGGVREALDGLNRALATVRRQASAEAWQRVVTAARAHPLRELVHRDPFTFRCFAKPRGYAGDPVALDYVLRRRELAVRKADPVAELHHCTTHGALARALIDRRDLTARFLGEAAQGAEEPLRVFAAGCGHLRECDALEALIESRVARLVAFDSDPDGLEAVRRDYPRAPITTHVGSVRQLIEGHHLFGEMDFVHAGAFLDALPGSVTVELARALLAIVRPGGTLLLTSMLDRMPEAGYVEAYMDWRIHYRTREILESIAGAMPVDAIDGASYVENAEATVGAIAIRRR